MWWGSARRGRAWLVAAVAVVGLAGVAVAVASLVDRARQPGAAVGERRHSRPAVAPTEVRTATATALWREEARGAGIPCEGTELVARLLAGATPLAERELDGECPERWRESVSRFLAQFVGDFRDAELREGVCYWAAWLMAEALRRPPLTPAESDAVRRDYETFADEVAQVLRAEFDTRLTKPDRAKYADPIERGLDWVRAQLLADFDLFHRDPLFPALKSKLSDRQRREALKSLRSRSVPEPEFCPPMMELVEESYARDLESFFRSTPRAMVLYDVAGRWSYRRMVRNDYWGLMRCKVMTPLNRKGPWPMVAWLTPWDHAAGQCSGKAKAGKGASVKGQ